MRLLANLELRAKLLGAFAIVLVLLAGIGLFASNRLASINGTATTIATQHVTAIEAASRLSSAGLRFRTAEFRHVIAPDSTLLADADAEVQALRTEVDSLRRAYAPLADTDAERRAVARFDATWPVVLAYWDSTRAPSWAHQDSLTAVLMVRSRAHFNEARDAIDSLVSFNREQGALAAAGAAHDYGVARLVLLGVIAAGIVLGLVVALRVAAMIATPMRRLTDLARALATGDLAQEVPALPPDEIGQLAEALHTVIASERTLVAAAERLAAGDASVVVAPRSAADTLGRSMETLRTTLGRLEAATGEMSHRAEVGDLAYRADAQAFTGAYRTLLARMNATMDAVQAPIGEASTVLAALAGRDLTARMTGAYAGGFAEIQHAVNDAGTQLAEALLEVRSGASQVASASGQIAAGAQTLASGASEQAASLEEVSASLQELSATAAQAAGNAREALVLADAARVEADAGEERMTRLAAAVGEIKEASDRTARIIRTIDEIAFQTNLLALNAAVEAARAGDAGRGFAVVAEEVRALAQRSAEAARSTSSLIEQAVGAADNGVTLNAEVLASLRGIAGKVSQVSGVVHEISSASEQQATAVSQVNIAVAQLGDVVQQVASTSEESASAAEELSSQAETMNGVVGRFTLGDERGTVHDFRAPAATLRRPALTRYTPRAVGAVR